VGRGVSAREALLVAAGGALGATARWLVTVAVQRWAPGLPLGTWLVNAGGCLAAGALLATLEARGGSEATRLFVAVGILGGFTTFSSFAVDGLVLAREGRHVVALGYVASSVLVGLAAAWLGWSAVRALAT
jgi:CrcB protein